MTETNVTPAAVLMDVLTKLEETQFREKIQEAGGIDRADGVRPTFWEVRYELAHVAANAAKSKTDGPSWYDELDHSVSHVLAAEDMEELRGCLLFHAALVASWIVALDVRAEAAR